MVHSKLMLLNRLNVEESQYFIVPSTKFSKS